MQGAQDLLVGADRATAAGIHPRPEGEDRVTFVAVADQHPTPTGQRIGRHGSGQPRLADARVPHQGGDVSVPLDGLLEQLSESSKLCLPPE